MTELINNNSSPHLDLVDNSNNSVDIKLSQASHTSGQERNNAEDEEEEEEEHTIRIPFFTLDKYKKGLISKFDEIIGIFDTLIIDKNKTLITLMLLDVRTPLEFQEDRVPGSINWPVLSNEERVEVGTLYAK